MAISFWKIKRIFFTIINVPKQDIPRLLRKKQPFLNFPVIIFNIIYTYIFQSFYLFIFFDLITKLFI